MNRIPIILAISFILCTPSSIWAGKARSRYTTLLYSNRELLNEFNDQIRLGRKLSYNLRTKNILTVEDEVLAKLDAIIEKAEVVLDMFPDQLQIAVVLLKNASELSRVYKNKYGKMLIISPIIPSLKTPSISQWPTHDLRFWPMRLAMPL